MFTWRKAVVSTFTFMMFLAIVLLLAFFNSTQRQEPQLQDYVIPLNVNYGCAVEDLQITTNTTWSTNQCYGNVTISNGATLTIAGNTTHELNTLTVGDGVTNGFIDVLSNTALGVGSTINANVVEVKSSSSITSNGRGFAAGNGPAPGGYYIGGSHAGIGTAKSHNSIYGSVSAPTTLGSGGGDNPGGGAIKINVADTLTNNGAISANATNRTSCATGRSTGAGGSVWVNFENETTTFDGNGTISANGGTGNSGFCGKGGGGRVAITGLDINTFSGSLRANSGGTSNNGNSGAGTVFVREFGATKGELILADSFGSGATPIINSDLVDVNKITINAHGRLFPADNTTLTIPDNTDIELNASGLIQIPTTSQLTFGSQNTFTVAASSSLVSYGTLNATSLGSLTIGGTLTTNHEASNLFPDDVKLSSTGVINHPAGQRLELSFNNLLVEVGGQVNLDGLGFSQRSGPGAGSSTQGGSHAGIGSANSSSSTYGSVSEPTTLGSGGASRAGGGAAKISIAQSLTLNGSITANGLNMSSCPDNAGGGAGGSVWIDFTQANASFSGSGTISANGGTSTGGSYSFCYKGGGGRISITGYENNNYLGSISANGGGTSHYGNAGTGTIFERAFSESSGKLTLKNTITSGNTPLATNDVTNVDEILVDTNAIAFIAPETELIPTSNTLFTLNGGLTISSTSSFINNSTNNFITSINSNITNNGTVSITGEGSASFGNVTNNGTFTTSKTSGVTLNATFTVSETSTTNFEETLTISSTGTVTTIATQPAELTFENLTIDNGGKIDVNGKGYASGQGPEPGQQWRGGSHAGQGQAGGHFGNPAISDDQPYGSIDQPTSMGSGGFTVPGGGAVKLNIQGDLLNNGSISSLGNSYTSGNNQGSGAGGSIWINFTGEGSTLSGSGSISANGGHSNYTDFYGGGGGRISITGHSTNLFAGLVTASGRSGASAGTIYERLTEYQLGTLTISNKYGSNLSTLTNGTSTIISQEVVDIISTLIIIERSNAEIGLADSIDFSELSSITLASNANLNVNGILNFTNSEFEVSQSASLNNFGTVNLSNTTLTLNGTYRSGNQSAINNLGEVVIGSTGTVTTVASQPAEVNFESLTIDNGGKIDVNGLGYAGGQGPGTPSNNYRGAGHGGLGHNGYLPELFSQQYGSILEPITMGSGGYGSSSAYGGGAIKLNISGNLINNGSITANATTYGDAYKGSGSGGSIWINFVGEHSTLDGSGTISANGGSSPWYGGAGGRISITGYSEDTSTGHVTAGSVTTTAAYSGGAGTIHRRSINEERGSLTISNKYNSNSSKPSTYAFTLIREEDLEQINTLTISSGAIARTLENTSIQTQPNTSINIESGTTLLNYGALMFGADDTLNLTPGATFSNHGTFNSSNITEVSIDGTFIIGSTNSVNIFPDTRITSAGTITAEVSQPSEITFKDLVIDQGGKVDFNGKGYAVGEGPSPAGQQYYGAGHGGQGNGGTATYGSITEPTTMGSGGYGSALAYGGGAIKLNIEGNLINNGLISANGATYGTAYNGSGSGGSVWINFTNIESNWSGSGNITANGGSSPFFSGGGGRVSVTNYNENNSTGFITAAAITTSYSTTTGGAGTIYMRSLDESEGTLIISNKYDATNSKPLYDLSNRNTPITEDLTLKHLIVENNTRALLSSNLIVSDTTTIDGLVRFATSSTQYLGNVIIGNTGSITHSNNTSTLQHSINIKAHTLSIATGGTITANGAGYAGGTSQQGGQGPGAGSGTASGGAGGAGHGGEGANGTGANGGAIYGSATNPADLGSGGGAGQSGAGGAGGGLIILDINDQLNVSGSITANGSNGASTGGGGSGGSINIRAEEFNCTGGSISANGGAGGTNGGQGGGGRVAYLTSEYSACNSISVSGAQNGTINDVVVVETPTGLHASNVTHNSITWTWTDNSENETAFRIYDSLGNIRGTKSSTTTNETGVLVSYTETGLTPNTLYSRRVASVSGIDEGLKSTSVLVQTRAQTPSAPNANVLSPFEIKISVGSDSNPSYTQYAIALHGPETYVQADGTLSEEPLWQTKAQWNENSGVIVGNLDPNTTYSFKIKARSNDYVETIYSVRATTTYAPAPPPPVIEPEETTVTISVPNSGGGSGSGWAYRCGSNCYIQSDGSTGTTKYFHPTPEITVSDLVPGTSYTFEVVTINHEGVETEYSEPVTIVTLAVAPNDPQLSVVAHDKGRIKLTSDINPSYTAYAIREATTNRFLQGNGTLGVNPAWHTKTQWQFHLDGYMIEGLTPNTQYSFSVVARNATNINTAHTPLQSIRTFAQIPPRPTAQTPTTSSFIATIDPGNNPASTQYIIEINGLYVQQDGTLGTDPVWQTYSQWGAESGIEVTGLQEDTSYDLSTKARNNDEIETDNSESTIISTLWSGPLPPTVTPASDTSINVVINNEIYDESFEFAIIEIDSNAYVNENGELVQDPTWQTFNSWGANNGIDVTGLDSNTQYTFATIARDPQGLQDLQSNQASTYTFASTPLAPTATEISYTSFIAWLTDDNNPNHTRYTLKLGNQYLNQNGEPTNETYWAPLNQWNVSGTTIGQLNQDTNYTITVQAINENNISTAESEPLTIRTLQQPSDTTTTIPNPTTTVPSGPQPQEETPTTTTPVTTSPTTSIPTTPTEEQPQTQDPQEEIPEVEGQVETNPRIDPLISTVLGIHSATGAWILRTIYAAILLALMGASLLLSSKIKTRDLFE